MFAREGYTLLLAAAVTLAWNLRAWADPGWQLSFAAVAGILTLGVPLQRVLRKAVDEIAGAREARRPPAEAPLVMIATIGGGDCTVNRNTFVANECLTHNYQSHLTAM